MAENRQNDGEYIKKFRAYGVILGTPPPWPKLYVRHWGL